MLSITLDTPNLNSWRQKDKQQDRKSAKETKYKKQNNDKASYIRCIVLPSSFPDSEIAFFIQENSPKAFEKQRKVLFQLFSCVSNRPSDLIVCM